MHIKRIIVEGFKSYRDRQKIPAKTEFVEGHCVVGASA
jgi:chromosome segregation ATPase